jgi:threonylcarbamoyladenosine tRNA methylthiotransferase MtaB
MTNLKTYFIYTFGCKVNRYETELIAQKLQSQGLNAVDNPTQADTIIFNSCTVTAKADKECLYLIRKSLKLPHNPKIILTGCMAKNSQYNFKDLFSGIEIEPDKNKLFDNPTQTLNKFDNRSRAFLKIQDGCNAFCSYCIVPFVRNKLWSKDVEVVLGEIKNFVAQGFSEIVLTGIHIGKFETGISNLLEKIMELKGDFRIRLSSIELNEIDDKLIKLMQKNPEKICQHLHIPLQSGSDKILELMNRKYHTKDFENKIKELATLFQNISITTDIITGFPQETQTDHQQTLNFINKNPFSRLHIFRYSDRTGTKANTFPNKVPPEEIKLRSKALLEIDTKKREQFLLANAGSLRPAVSIGTNKSLTDNYLTIPHPPKQGIFKVLIPLL